MAKLISPDAYNLIGMVERSVADSNPEIKLEFEFKDVNNLICGLYRVDVEIYEDDTKEAFLVYTNKA